MELGGRNANIRLPEIPNASVSSADRSALWLGPREWLILTPRGLEPELQRSLRATLTNRSCAVTDVTNGNTVMCLTGMRALDVLAKGCSVDLHDLGFGPGSCVQTYVAKLVCCCGDGMIPQDLI